jgi:hypothetical protein
VSSNYLRLLAGMVVLAAGMALAMTPATNAIVRDAEVDLALAPAPFD